MINRIVWASGLSILFFSSCSSENDLCKCIAKGDELNRFSNELLFQDDVSKSQEEKLNQLRNEVEEICRPFQEMNPDQLREMRMSCPDALAPEE
jgi:hypothetical protein